MTPQTDLRPLFPNAASCPRAVARGARPARPRAPALCAAMLCAGSLWAGAAHARTPRAPRAASAPTTAQVLAPSAATVPDALPPAQLIYRCGNSYAPRPCADEGSKPLDVADARSDAQRRQAEDVSTRDKRLASWLEAGRRDRERAASAPTAARAARAPAACVETSTMACTPRKPRPRHAVTKTPKGAKAASGAANAN